MCYYPTEFIAAMLNSVMGINEKVAFYVRFAKEQGIEVLPPDINESKSKFTVSGNSIRFGLAAIKNVGVNVVENVVKSREEKGKFKDLMDFVNKIDTSMVNKRAVESFIKSGAFDSFGIFRSKLLAVFERILDGVSSQRKKNIDGQMSLFGDFSTDVEEIKLTYPNIKEFEKKYILAMEKEMTGIYLTGHPLDEYVDTLNNATSTNISDIIVSQSLDEGVQEVNSYVKDNDMVIIGGILTEVSKKITRNNTMMAFVKLEDLYGTIEVIVFPKIFQKNLAYLHEDSLVTIKGRVTIREDEAPKIICDEIKPLVKQLDEKLYIRVQNDAAAKDAALYLRRLPAENKGYMPVYVFIAEKNQAFVINKDLWVSNDIETLARLRGYFGEENVKIK